MVFHLIFDLFIWFSACPEAGTWSVLLKKVFLKISKKETSTHLFSYEVCKIFKNIYFKEHLRTAASASLRKQ